jgi:hypothetical protein
MSMNPVRIIKNFADLAGVLREVAAATPPAAYPPMTPKQVEDAARAFVAYRRSGPAPSSHVMAA